MPEYERITAAEAAEKGELCHEGPCERDEGNNLTGYRLQCFKTETGCDDCYLVESPTCV